MSEGACKNQVRIKCDNLFGKAVIDGEVLGDLRHRRHAGVKREETQRCDSIMVGKQQEQLVGAQVSRGRSSWVCRGSSDRDRLTSTDVVIRARVANPASNNF